MDYTGLYAKKYRVNRRLSNEERSNKFVKNKRYEITPFYNISVINLNSAYLELIDRWFICRGSMTAVCLMGLAFPICSFLIPLILVVGFDYVALCIFFGLSIPYWMIMGWLLSREAFSWTHFPIRLDYRNRMVYVFRRNGTVLSAKWDDVFFTLGRCERMVGRQNWDIRGHVLDKDGETVLETFALPGDTMRVDQLRHCWEFIRRYMEEGPASVYRDVYWCHDIAERREKYTVGLRYMFFSLNGQPIGQILLSPVFFLASLGRWFAMRTSRIPVWPAEIEAACAVDPFDPYLRDASRNPEKIPMEPM